MKKFICNKKRVSKVECKNNDLILNDIKFNIFKFTFKNNDRTMKNQASVTLL